MSTFLIIFGIIVTGLTPTVAVVVGRILDRQDRKDVHGQLGDARSYATEARAESTAQLDEIHVLVNSRLSQALERIKGLEEALGIAPEDEVPTKAKE